MNITIRLNGAPLHIDARITVADLLVQLEVSPLQVATAVNGDFVPRDARPAWLLCEGDQVMTFQPIVGG